MARLVKDRLQVRDGRVNIKIVPRDDDRHGILRVSKHGQEEMVGPQSGFIPGSALGRSEFQQVCLARRFWEYDFSRSWPSRRAETDFELAPYRAEIDATLGEGCDGGILPFP